MNKYILTIVIPTYNRHTFIHRSILVLLPQLSEFCKLIIVDNHSTPSVEVYLNKKIESLKDYPISFIYNKANIGSNANIIRCIEVCETPYLWILGDDDLPLSNCISTILLNISSNPKIIFFNFSCEIYFRSQNKFTTGIKNFINNIDSFSNLLFISNNIYHVPSVIENIQFSYQYIYSSAAHLAILFPSFSTNEQALFSNEQIVSWGKPSEEMQWSQLFQSLGLFTLLEIPIIIQENLVENLAKTFRYEKLRPVNIFRAILFLTDNSNYSYKSAKYLFDQIFFRRLYFENRITRLKRIPLHFLLRFPKTIFYLYSKYYLYIKKTKYSIRYDPFFNQR